MHGIVFSYRYYAALGQTTSITRILNNIERVKRVLGEMVTCVTGFSPGR